MPIFEFRCSRCSHTFEDLVIGSRLPEQCPQCGSADIEKMISSFSFKSAAGDFKSSGSSGCSSCSSKNCSSCR